LQAAATAAPPAITMRAPASSEAHTAHPNGTVAAHATVPAGATAKVVWAEGAVKAEAAKTPSTPLRRTTPVSAQERRTPRPPATSSRRPTAAVRSQSQRSWIPLVSAALVVAAISAGAWLRFNAQPVSPDQQPSTLFAQDTAKDVPETDDRTPKNDHPAHAPAVTQVRESAPPPKASAPNRPTTSAAARSPRQAKPSAAAKNVRPPSPSTREVPAAPAVIPDAVPAPSREVVAPAFTAAAPEPPVGPFYEPKDVNETPRVAKRVEPRLPAELRARQINEVVIVRALVSQSGRPSRVSLLRRSKTGPELDSVVVEAVNQWTFSPARKKGEPVSCWLNFGVPVGRAD
jgi:TonB family protein